MTTGEITLALCAGSVHNTHKFAEAAVGSEHSPGYIWKEKVIAHFFFLFSPIEYH